MEPRLSSDPVAEDLTSPATAPDNIPSPDLTRRPDDETAVSSVDADDDIDAADIDDESAVGHADPDADLDLDSEPPEHELPPETDPAMTFADLKLIRPLFEAVTYAGYVHPTPVQEAVIPVALRGKDVIGQAQTGTGKTAAFLLPFMNRWRPHKFKGPIGLVMTPTRELALQVAMEAEKLAPSRRFRTVAVYGGARMGRQLEGLARGCDLVVGTPGRMLDHLRRGSLSLTDIKYVVLDEADRMLDIGFRPDIERILKRCPLSRQTLLMSATVPEAIKKLVHRYMTDPVHLQMTPEVLTVDKIRQSYFTVDAEKKFDLLVKVIEREHPRQCLIFVERKRWADNLYRDLKKKVPNVAVIHGDLPLDIESYVHRIGRTGRIGKDGIAISFVTPEQGSLLTDIEVMINKLIEPDEVPGEWYTSRRVSPRAHVDEERDLVKEQIASVRDDSGWGIDEEELTGGKLGVAEGDTPPAEEAPTAPGTKKPIFGKPRHRYSARL